MLKFGQTVAKELFPGAFIAMFGDLGAGKTTFVRGIAAELQIDDIASPTFTIVRSHRGSALSLDHFDAYRLENFDELFAIGYQDYLDSESVIVMEWCENVPEALPRERLELHLSGSGSEPRSVEALASLAAEFSLAGIGVWNIMRPFPALWTVLSGLYSIVKL